LRTYLLQQAVAAAQCQDLKHFLKLDSRDTFQGVAKSSKEFGQRPSTPSVLLKTALVLHSDRSGPQRHRCAARTSADNACCYPGACRSGILGAHADRAYSRRDYAEASPADCDVHRPRFVGGRGRPRRSRKPNALDQIVDVLSVSLLIRCIVLPFLIAAAARGTEQNGYGQVCAGRLTHPPAPPTWS
jgi:hypothetical protein